MSKIFISRDGFRRTRGIPLQVVVRFRCESSVWAAKPCRLGDMSWPGLGCSRKITPLFASFQTAKAPLSQSPQSPQNTIRTVLLRTSSKLSNGMIWYASFPGLCLTGFTGFMPLCKANCSTIRDRNCWIYWKWGGVSRWYLLLWLQPRICRGRWIWQWKQFAGGCHCGTARDVSGCGFLFLFFFFFALLNITQRVLFRIGLKPPTPALVLLRLQVKSRSLNTQRSQIRELSMLRWCHFVSGGSFDVFEILWVCQYVPKSAYTPTSGFTWFLLPLLIHVLAQTYFSCGLARSENLW